MIYAFSTTDASKIEFDDVGWPCTAAYPPEEVAEVTENVQSVNTG
jgi:hypothetical protein